MFEILAPFAILAWTVFSVWLAFRLARFVSQRSLKVLIIVLAAPLLSAAPLADEIIGKVQFDRLCNAAEEVQIYSTTPVGTDLYYPDGRWRLDGALSFDEFKKIRAVYDSLVEWKSAQIARNSEIISISESETKIVNRKTGQLLASFHSFGTPGGWLSRYFEKPTLVRDQCLPASFSSIDQKILPFSGSAGVQR